MNHVIIYNCNGVCMTVKLYTMYIICLWRISESIGFIWSIPPICSCTNISIRNNIIIMIHVLAFFVI